MVIITIERHKLIFLHGSGRIATKRCKFACNRPLSRTVATKLQLNCSPEQIAGWVKIEYPNEENNRVSHETIYYSLFVRIQSIFKKEQQYLRSKRTIRCYKHANLKRDNNQCCIDQ